MELQAAYLKECVRKNLIHLGKMPGKENTSDILTKHYSAEVIRKMREKIGILNMVVKYIEVLMVQLNTWKDIIAFPKPATITDE